jgi:hypothetical protein
VGCKGSPNAVTRMIFIAFNRCHIEYFADLAMQLKRRESKKIKKLDLVQEMVCLKKLKPNKLHETYYDGYHKY